jgi:hypothetical protein
MEPETMMLTTQNEYVAMVNPDGVTARISRTSVPDALARGWHYAQTVVPFPQAPADAIQGPRLKIIAFGSSDFGQDLGPLRGTR